MSRETQGDEALYEYGQLPCKKLCLARAVTKHTSKHMHYIVDNNKKSFVRKF